MTPLPLNVVLKNPRTNVQMTISANLQGGHISTVVPGGFGTFTFTLGERPARNLDFPLELFYGSDIVVSDFAGSTLFEGILTDVKYHSDQGDSRYECEAAGSMLLLDEPYRNVVIERNLAWIGMPVAVSTTLVRPSLMPLSIGQVSATDSTIIGTRVDIPTSTVMLNNYRNGPTVYFPPGTRLTRMKCDYDVDMSRTATMHVELSGIDDSGGRHFLQNLISVGTIGTGSLNIDLSGLGVNSRGVDLVMACDVGGTTSAPMWAQLTNFRFFSTRTGPTGTFTDESVFGHEIVTDIISQSSISKDYSGIELDTSYAVPEFSYQVSDTCRNALDTITAYYSRYWAVWESKKFYWKSWSSTQLADWIVSKSSGAQVDIDPSITNTANVIRIQYQDAAGIQQEATVTDARADNVYTLAGRTRTSIVPLGITTTSTAATQLGSTYFPDHSYEVVGGTITMPAEAKCFSQTYGTMLPAYKIRAGETVRLRDGNSTRSLFDDRTWNRSTLFRITATDLDWEAQTISLTLDNSQASLDQIMARVQTSLTAKYGL